MLVALVIAAALILCVGCRNLSGRGAAIAGESAMPDPRMYRAGLSLRG